MAVGCFVTMVRPFAQAGGRALGLQLLAFCVNQKSVAAEAATHPAAGLGCCGLSSNLELVCWV